MLSEISDVHLDTLPFKLQPGRMSVELTEEVKLRMERAVVDMKKKAAMAEVSGMKWECCDCTYVACAPINSIFWISLLCFRQTNAVSTPTDQRK